MVPPSVATLQAPSQVMLQVPEVQVTFEPAPAVCVHDLPAQLTLHPLPQVPVQVAPDAHAKLQPLVDELHVSKPHVWSDAQLQFVPEHTVPQPDIARPNTDTASTINARSFMSSSERDEWPQFVWSHASSTCPSPTIQQAPKPAALTQINRPLKPSRDGLPRAG